LIESPAHIVQRMTPRWLYRACLAPVKKASASAFVYRRIIQQLPDAATKHFRQRNGFTMQKTMRFVVEKLGTRRQAKEKPVMVPVQKYRPVNLGALINVSAIGYNPEENCLANRLLEGMSAPTQKIARLLLTGGKRADSILSKKAGVGTRQATFARAELSRKLKHQKYPAGLHPVHFNAEQVE